MNRTTLLLICSALLLAPFGAVHAMQSEPVPAPGVPDDASLEETVTYKTGEIEMTVPARMVPVDSFLAGAGNFAALNGNKGKISVNLPPAVLTAMLEYFTTGDGAVSSTPGTFKRLVEAQDMYVLNYRVKCPPFTLHAAALQGRTDMGFELLNRGADPNAKDNQGMTALHVAARNAQLEMVKVLLEGGADPLITFKNGDKDEDENEDEDEGQLAIDMLIKAFSVRQRQLKLQRNEYEAAVDQMLFAMHQRGLKHYCSLAMDMGLHNSAISKRMIGFLNENFVTNVADDQDEIKLAILEYAVQKEDRLLTEMVLADSKPDELGEVYHRLFNRACELGWLEIVRFSVDRKFITDVNHRDQNRDSYNPITYGDAAVHHAARAGQTEVVQYLVETAPDALNLEGQGRERPTPLRLALDNNHRELAKWIREEISRRQ